MVKVFISRAEDRGFEYRLCRVFRGQVIPVTSKLALQWLPTAVTCVCVCWNCLWSLYSTCKEKRVEVVSIVIVVIYYWGFFFFITAATISTTTITSTTTTNSTTSAIIVLIISLTVVCYNHMKLLVIDVCKHHVDFRNVSLLICLFIFQSVANALKRRSTLTWPLRMLAIG